MDSNNSNSEPTFMISKIIKRMRILHKEILATYNLSSIHAGYLIHLCDKPDGLTLMQLSDLVCVDRANTTRVVNDLEAKGYLLRNVQQLNEKKYKVILTDTGKQIAGVICKESKLMQEKTLKVLTKEEIKTLYQLLTKINNSLED